MKKVYNDQMYYQKCATNTVCGICRMLNIAVHNYNVASFIRIFVAPRLLESDDAFMGQCDICSLSLIVVRILNNEQTICTKQKKKRHIYCL